MNSGSERSISSAHCADNEGVVEQLLLLARRKFECAESEPARLLLGYRHIVWIHEEEAVISFDRDVLDPQVDRDGLLLVRCWPHADETSRRSSLPSQPKPQNSYAEIPRMSGNSRACPLWVKWPVGV